MVQIYKTPFAAQGDKDAIPVPVQGDGAVSVTQGFGYDYEREYEDPAAKDIRREIMNGILHDLSEAIGEMQQFGFAAWQPVDGGWPVGAVVTSSGRQWVSISNSNTAEPSSSSALWKELNIGAVAPGVIHPFAGTAANVPDGFLLCNGAALGRTTYQRLFSVIGTAYGAGDGSTTYNLPDFRGVFLRGLDNGRGFDPSRTLGSLQQDENKSHLHGFRTEAGGGTSGPFVVFPDDAWILRANVNANATVGTPETYAAGGDEARPKNVSVNYIIKY